MKETGLLKAPRTDGFQACYFQKTWNTTGPGVFYFVKKVLEEMIIPVEATEAMLVLIPKVESPSDIRSFYPH